MPKVTVLILVTTDLGKVRSSDVSAAVLTLVDRIENAGGTIYSQSSELRPETPPSAAPAAPTTPIVPEPAKVDPANDQRSPGPVAPPPDVEPEPTPEPTPTPATVDESAG